MNYIYDILLNFKDSFYEFYDWNKNDNILHIRKIPIFRISTFDLNKILNNKVKLDFSFLEKIKDKTELFTNNGVKKLKYACLLSDSEMIVGISIVQKKIKISSLLIDEELDSIEDVYRMDVIDLKYNVIKEKKRNVFKTRKQIEKIEFLKIELLKIKNEEKLKYLYYECFDKKENDIDKIVLNLINLDDDKIIDKVYNFFKLIEVNK